MAETVTTRHTRIRHPSDIAVENDAPAEAEGTRRSRRRGPARETSADVFATDALIDALAEDGNITILDDFDIVPAELATTPEGRRRRRAAPDGQATTEVEVDIAENENAVLLVESDGVYAWRFPQEAEPRRGRRRGGSSGKTLTFTIEEAHPEDGGARRGRRGLSDWIAGKIKDRIRAIVVKFVAGKAVGAGQRLLERNVKPGMIAITDDYAESWKAGDAAPDVPLPKDRPARILLMIHGTFSSTLGSFGALSLMDEGRAFLKGALDRYDAILAFDHRTLSEFPQENAQAIMTALGGLAIPPGSTADLVGFSRGGLVTRLLVEEMLGAAGWPLTPQRAVFVGCTNGGTGLADPENWKTLLDLFTNIAVAAGKGMALLGGWVAGPFVTESLKTIGAFVQAVVDTAVTEEMVPGISAMSPTSPLVRQLNDPGRASDQQQVDYFAIGSNFEPKLFNSNLPASLPKRLMQALADLGVDTLMRETNDLVVDNEAMTQFGIYGPRLRESHFWGPNAVVFHTNYFAQPDVARLLRAWLIDRSDAAGAAIAVKPALTLDTDTPAGIALEKLQSLGPDEAVLLNRSAYGQYVRRARDMMSDLRRADPDADLVSTLDLHENGLAARRSEHEPAPQMVPPVGETILDRDGNVARVVLPASPGPREQDMLLAEPPEEVGAEPDEAPPPRPTATPRPSTRLSPGKGYGYIEPEEPKPASDRRRGRNAILEKSFGAPAHPKSDDWSLERSPRELPAAAARPRELPEEAAPPAPQEAEVECHFAAEMDRSVPLETPAELTVTVSREEIVIAAGKAAATATKTVKTDKPIEIHVTAVANCSVVGADRTEIVVPKPGEPEVYVFDIRGEQPGAAEIWVDAMQGARRLARFVLQPQFVATGKISTSANVSTAQEDPPMLGIRVYEVPTGRKDSFYLRFVVESRDLNLRMEEETDEFDVAPEAYIKSLYAQLEGSWGAGLTFEQFMVRLRSFGNTLYRKLVPEPIQRAIWDKRDSIGSIEIISHEPFIPWEVLHISEPGQKLPPEGNVFLGELGVVRWLPNAGWAPASIKFRPDHARHVIPDYANPADVLEGAVEERAMVETLFNSKPFEANSAKLIFDLKSHGDVDVLHFACHGAAEGERIWNASLLMAGTRDKDSGKVTDDVLTVDLVESYAELGGADGSRPIVFLNACQAGKTGRALTGTGGMAQAFIGGGAGLFIGTQWSIGDKTALVFANTFYQRLLAGDTVNQATRAARGAAKTAEEPTWLAYTVYGHPYARLVME